MSKRNELVLLEIISSLEENSWDAGSIPAPMSAITYKSLIKCLCDERHLRWSSLVRHFRTVLVENVSVLACCLRACRMCDYRSRANGQRPRAAHALWEKGVNSAGGSA